MKTTVIALFIILNSMLILSCGSPEPLPTPGVAATDFPLGRFKGAMGGEYQFFEDGKYEKYFESTGNEVHDSGTYIISGDQIEFIAVKGHCIGEDGVYAWEFDGDALRFSVLRDFCSERKKGLANYSWEKVTGD